MTITKCQCFKSELFIISLKLAHFTPSLHNKLNKMVHNSTTTTEWNSHPYNTTHATAYASQQPNHLPTHPSQPLESANTSNAPRNNLKRSVKVPPYLFILLLFSTNTIQSLVFSLDASIICNKIVGLVPKQRRMCRAYPEAMATIGNGAELAMRECQEQFALRRWNCSLSTKEPLLLFMSRIGGWMWIDEWMGVG